MTEHSAIGPSALGRLLNCAGSHALSAGLSRGASSFYAAEGTVVHDMSERGLNGEVVDAMLDETHEVDGHFITVNQDMVNGAKAYVEECAPLMRDADLFWIEKKVDIGGVFGPEGPPLPFFGTVDFAAYHREADHLWVKDLKYGRMAVSPEDNPQALAYAVGAVLQLPSPPATVSVTIVQPRDPKGDKVKTWETTGLDLLIWADTVLVPGIKALFEPDALLKPGDWCGFCPALHSCSAVKDLAMKTAKMDFAAVPPDPAVLTDEEVAMVLNRAEIIRKWIGAVLADGAARIDQGGSVPGWKLVPKKGIRKWDDPAQVEAIVGGDNEDFYTRKLKSPTQIEKVAPDVYENLKVHVTKSSSGTTLVPDIDPREAVLAAAAKDQFGVIE